MNEFELSPEDRKALVVAKIKDAEEMIAVAKMNAQYEFYNSALNRLYYACFHIAGAALISYGFDNIKRHEGVRNMFSLHFIKTGKLSSKWNHFYSYMFSCRSSADYDSFEEFTKEDIDELLPQVEGFVTEVKALIVMD